MNVISSPVKNSTGRKRWWRNHGVTSSSGPIVPRRIAMM
jgi:hypothetical protein